jgi:c-di-AMP phosphodiesterase-like protein
MTIIMLYYMLIPSLLLNVILVCVILSQRHAVNKLAFLSEESFHSTERIVENSNYTIRKLADMYSKNDNGSVHEQMKTILKDYPIGLINAEIQAQVVPLLQSVGYPYAKDKNLYHLGHGLITNQKGWELHTRKQAEFKQQRPGFN